MLNCLLSCNWILPYIHGDALSNLIRHKDEDILKGMANSKYEYVKSFEVEDEVTVPNIIVVRIDGRDFGRFSEAHEFDKPYDAKALHLMNACSTAILEEFPDIAFAYGFSDEFSFVFKKETKFYQRRARYCIT
nr:truncated ICARUS1 [Ipomoea batatas]